MASLEFFGAMLPEVYLRHHDSAIQTLQAIVTAQLRLKLFTIDKMATVRPVAAARRTHFSSVFLTLWFINTIYYFRLALLRSVFLPDLAAIFWPPLRRRARDGRCVCYH